MADSPALTEDIVAAIASLAADAVITQFEPLTGGVSAEVSRVTFVSGGDESRIVVRRHRDVAGKPARAERAEREYALLRVLHAHGVPVPRPRAFVPPQTLLLDWVAGEASLPGDPADGRDDAIADALASALAAIHAITDGAGLPALPLLTDPLPALCEWLPLLPLRDVAAARMPPFSGSPRLLHGDYWPGNVLWRDGQLVAVIDWEDAGLGDPLTDVACARVELCCARGEAMAERFAATYARIAAIDADRLPWWDLFVSTAALQFMDDWGLAPEVLAARKAATTAFQANALARLGIA